MIFSKHLLSTIKKVLLLTVFLLGLTVQAQKNQRIGYIDMEYILENIPEYQEAQKNLDAKVVRWKQKLEAQKKEIETLKNKLYTEKVLLTKELIQEKEEEIAVKEATHKKNQETYFGAKGEMFFLRQQLVKPVQDKVYNAIQTIAQKRNYDFVLDKSTSNAVMLYTNKKFDVSEMVLKQINKQGKDKEQIIDKRSDRAKEVEEKQAERIKEKTEERNTKREELKKRIEERKALQQKKREERKRKIEERRQQRLKKIEEAKNKRNKKQ